MDNKTNKKFDSEVKNKIRSKDYQQYKTILGEWTPNFEKRSNSKKDNHSK